MESGTISDTVLFVEGGKFVAPSGKEPDQSYDFSGCCIVPGFIDAHVHVESSFMTPSSFAASIIPHGTAAVVADPHEIANVSGLAGIDFMMKDSEDLPIRFYFTAPSCVPATGMETAGATLGVREIESLMDNPRVVGLGEMMNFPGVVLADPEVMGKIEAAKRTKKVLDGHCPGLSGSELKRYVSAGLQSDHECTTPEEALEKLSLGMHIMVREGSAMRNMERLIGIVNDKTEQQCMFVSDDIHPETILKEGHMDRILRKAVSRGLDPVMALRMVTLNPAKYFSLKDLGSLKSGMSATFAVVRDLKEFEVLAFFVDGEPLYVDGNLVARIGGARIPEVIRSSVRIRPLDKEDLMVRSSAPAEVRVIQIPDDKTTARLGVENGFLEPDRDHDILPIVVIERHRATGNIGKGFVTGFGLKSGALASTFAHDSHNIICVGADYGDMVYAVRALEMAGGGLVVVKEGRTLAILELPVAGLMSDQPARTVNTHLDLLLSASKELGCTVDFPFMVLAFLALPVIPKLKLTDKGLVDVEKFRIVDVIM